jgi:hypothetical protein
VTLTMIITVLLLFIVMTERVEAGPCRSRRW